MFWDSDFYRVSVHKAFLAVVGASGSCSIFEGDADEHSEYAMQVCNERLLLIQHKKDGRDIYTWKSKEPHDALDSTAQAFAVAASQGISGTNIQAANVSQRSKLAVKKRPKIRVV